MVNIIWSKYPLTQADWEEFAQLNHGKRCKFLKEHKLQYNRGEVPRCEDCDHAFFNCKCLDEEYHKKRELQDAEMAKPFSEKLKYSEDLVKLKIEQIIRTKKKVYLGFSGGIDSESCLQLFKEAITQNIVKVVVGNTLTELPDTYKRLYQAEKELGVDFIWATPIMGVTFESNACSFGLPLYSRSNYKRINTLPINYDSTLNVKNINTSENIKRMTKLCCANLKEKPQKLCTKGFDGDILGLRATESSGRAMAIKRLGDCSNITTTKWHIRPIAWWTRDDEWNFQKLRGFNYNGIYDKTNIGKIGKYKTSTGRIIDIRSGCAYCPQGIHQGYLEWLYEFYPKYFEKLVKIYDNVAIKYGDGIDFKKVLEIKKVKDPRDLKEKPQPF